MPTCAIACKTLIHVCMCTHTHTYFTHTLRSPSPSHQGQTTVAAFQPQPHDQLTLTFRRGVPDFCRDKEPAEVTQFTFQFGSPTCRARVPLGWVRRCANCRCLQTQRERSFPSMRPTPRWESTEDGAGGPPSTQGSRIWTLWGPSQIVGYLCDRFPSAWAGSGEGQLQGSSDCRAPAGEPLEDAGDEGPAPSHLLAQTPGWEDGGLRAAPGTG